MARDDECSPMRGKEGAMDQTKEINMVNVIGNIVDNNLEILKSILANTKLQNKMMHECRDALVYGIQLKAANIENTISAQENIRVVDESVLFRSLGGAV